MAGFALPIIGGLTDILGGFLGSNAAEKAAQQEAQQFKYSSQYLQDIGKAQNQQNLARLTPLYNTGLNAGRQGLGTLESLLKTPGQGLLQGYGSFSAPTLQEAQNTPGYQFTLQQGENALQNSAAARGDLLSGNTMKALTDYGQNLANTTYNDVYNRALNSYQTNAQNFYQNQANQYGRLMGLSGMGLQTGLSAAGQLGANSAQYENTMTNALNFGNQGAAAQAAGTMGAANAWQNALGGAAGWGMNLAGLLGGGNQMSPAFGSLSPGQISGAYGGPTSVPTIQSNASGYIPYNQGGY